jgi:hypothetical protein
VNGAADCVNAAADGVNGAADTDGVKAGAETFGVAEAAGVKGFGLKLLLELYDRLGSLAATCLIYAF